MSYLDVTYGSKPKTDYPLKLTKYLKDRYDIKGKLLDLGCGLGDHVRGFSKLGVIAVGVDRKDFDFDKPPFPYVSDTFDFVFTKSVLEHFYYPEQLVSEIYRILKPTGSIIAMVPEWGTHFYEDYTHRTAFTVSSLRDLLLVEGFTNVKTERFRQLPFLWQRPRLKFVSVLAKYVPIKCKLVRFSNEFMVLGSATKPRGWV